MEYQVWNSQSVSPTSGIKQGQYCNSASGAAISLAKGLVSGTFTITMGSTPITSRNGRIRICLATISSSLAPSFGSATKIPLTNLAPFEMRASQDASTVYQVIIPPTVVVGFNAYVWLDYEGFDATEAGSFTLNGYLTEVNI